MVSHEFVYQFVLFALIWLFILLHLTGSTSAAPPANVPAVSELLKPECQRSNEPKLFALNLSRIVAAQSGLNT
jgi:hypothetical protein